MAGTKRIDLPHNSTVPYTGGMERVIELEAHFEYKGEPVSALGYRLYRLREQIEAAAERGEIKLLNQDEFEDLISDEGDDD